MFLLSVPPRSMLLLCVAGLVFFAVAAGLAFSTAGQNSVPFLEADGGGVSPVEEPRDDITEEQRKLIESDIERNVKWLSGAGKIGPSSPEVVQFAWPVQKSDGGPGFSVDAISNYLDQAPPGQLLDWNCGMRTYDGHKGIDIYTWPFTWNLMDSGSVEVVAGAPGTIVGKFDGNYDRSCAMNNSMWNAVYVRHSDGSIAWYGHLKNGSVTTKSIGETVSMGEKLGLVGSSGNSTGPHLHFEVHTETNQLRDPFQGACNTINAESWWIQQEPNRVSRINRLMTHSAPPSFNTCPQPETSNEKSTFRPGESFRAAAYYRDQLQGHQTQYSILRPDGSVLQSWSHQSPNTYSSSYWFWTVNIPTFGPGGTWKFTALYNGQMYEQTFAVDPDVSISGRAVDPNGRGISRASISMTSPQGVTISVITSTAGYYVFQSVPFGEVRTIRASSKRYRFMPREVTLSNDLTDVDFTGIE
jgi:murein DD-endopeptidase MepM/ murein hydrolase activator NlpD